MEEMGSDSPDRGGREPDRRLWPSPAMVVALLALFVALGGSAWAVSKVGTNQLKNNAVTTPKIKPAAVNGSRLANRAVTESKIADGAVIGSKIAVGSVGAANLQPASVTFDTLADSSVQGSKIAPNAIQSGLIADQAVTSSKLAEDAVGGSNIAIETILGTPVSIPGGTSEVVTATCPQGKTAVSAGYQASNSLVVVYQLFVSGNTALVYAGNSGPLESSIQVTAKAVCI